jgi:hypothetical protein
MERVAKEEAMKVETTLDMTQYCMDYAEVFDPLAAKVAAGKLRFRLLLDKAQYEHPSCARGPDVLQSLFDAGVEIRTVKPMGSGFASQHSKSAIFDGKVLLDGSCNMTHNAFMHNIEHLIRITEPNCLQAAQASFEQHWPEGVAVDKDRMIKMREACVAIKEQRSKNNSARFKKAGEELRGESVVRNKEEKEELEVWKAAGLYGLSTEAALADGPRPKLRNQRNVTPRSLAKEDFVKRVIPCIVAM